jgi:tetratricopeptide (TPR) repeat protein
MMRQRPIHKAVRLLLAVTLWTSVQSASHEPPPLTPGQQAVLAGRYAEALSLLDQELAKAPGNTALLTAKVDALMGLHRFWEAGQVASSKMVGEPALRYRAGQCLLALGRVADAAQVLSPLRQDPAWAEKAYTGLVWALRAAGQEADAEGLLQEGLERIAEPTGELYRASLETDRDPRSILKTLDLLDRADPAGAPSRAGLRALCAAAGDGSLETVSLSRDLPADVPLSETPIPEDPSGTVSGSPRMPRRPAPSAQRFGSGDYSRLPPAIKYYAEAEKTNRSSSLLRLVVPVRLGGDDPVPMVLDTGVDVLMLAPDTAHGLGVKPLGTREVWTAGASEPGALDLVLVLSLTVGPLEMRNVPAVVLTDSGGSWKGLGGVLPVRLLSRYALHVDRVGGRLGIYPSGTRPEGLLGPAAFRVAALWSTGMPFMKVGIHEQSAFMLLNTSSSFSYLEPDVVGEVGAPMATARYGTQNDRGHLGLISSGVAADVSLSLGRATVYMPTVRVANLAPQQPLRCSGMLGQDVLRLFHLFLDYGAGVVALRGYDKGE